MLIMDFKLKAEIIDADAVKEGNAEYAAADAGPAVAVAPPPAAKPAASRRQFTILEKLKTMRRVKQGESKKEHLPEGESGQESIWVVD